MQAMKKPINSLESLTSLLFCELPMLADVVAQVSSTEVVHDQVNIVSVLEGVVHIDKEDVVQLRQMLPFAHDTLHRPFSDNPRFTHLFHGKLLLGLLLLDLPDLAEAAFADAMFVREGILRHG